jgi:hypothetical protein
MLPTTAGWPPDDRQRMSGSRSGFDMARKSADRLQLLVAAALASLRHAGAQRFGIVGRLHATLPLLDFGEPITDMPEDFGLALLELLSVASLATARTTGLAPSNTRDRQRQCDRSQKHISCHGGPEEKRVGRRDVSNAPVIYGRDIEISYTETKAALMTHDREEPHRRGARFHRRPVRGSEQRE